MPNPAGISVVIGSYNQCHRLQRVLDGFKDQKTTASFEVIIVDSNSTDGTADMVAGYTHLPFHLVFMQRDNPSGKSEARNVGVAHATHDIILITDADMVPTPTFIQAHVDAHAQAKTPCCFEGLAYNLVSEGWPPNLDEATTQVPRKYKGMDRLDWYYFLTGNVSFSKELFELEGGFSLDFKSYGWEDLELGYRLKKRGIPLYYLTTAKNIHYHVVSDDEAVERKFNMGQSAQIFLSKHPELKWFLGLNPLSVMVRKLLWHQHPLVQGIRALQGSRLPLIKRFSYWFMGEFNYLSGLLNLPHKG